MFDGSEQEAFVLGVKANIMHGLPLSLADRSAAAERIVASRPSWSDRTIAVVTGLSARTIGSIRARLEAEHGIGEDVKARIGQDGRVRPLDSAEGRLKAVSLFKDQPNASLREVARKAGVSPSTAHDVRNRIQRGEDPLPSARRSAGRRASTTVLAPKPLRESAQPDLGSILLGLKKDPSLRFSESGRTLLRWVFSRVVQPDEWNRFIDAVPPHSAYVIAKVARLCAQEWQDFADRLEKQSTQQTA
jgi:transposase-like protein